MALTGAPTVDTRVRHCVRWPAVTTRVAWERAVRERSGLNATSRSASSMARLTRAASSRAHHTPLAWRRSCSGPGGGRRLRVLCRRYLRWQRSGERATRRSPSYLKGTRGCEHGSRARLLHRARHAEVAPGVPILRQAQNRYASPDAFASTTEATRQRRSVSLEEPGARVRHETPGHPSRDVFRRAVSRTAHVGLHRLRGRRNFSPTVSGAAIATLQRLATPARS